MPPPPPTLLPLSDSQAEITRAGSYLRRRAPGIALFKWMNSTHSQRALLSRALARALAHTSNTQNTEAATRKFNSHANTRFSIRTGSRSRRWHIKLYLSFSYSTQRARAHKKPHRWRQLVEWRLLVLCSHIQFARQMFAFGFLTFKTKTRVFSALACTVQIETFEVLLFCWSKGWWILAKKNISCSWWKCKY